MSADKESVEVMKGIMRTMIRATKDISSWMLEGLPHEARTEGQRALQAKHGTPYEFGQACINALDMISSAEAKAAIDKYKQEWDAA